MECTKCRIEHHDGFLVCVVCGHQVGPYLCARESAKNHELKKLYSPYRQPYCRMHRFSRLVKRICGHGPSISDDLITFCHQYSPRTYKDVQLLVRIYRRETGKKPPGYAQVPSLFRILTGERLPILSPDEIKFVVFVFREIDFHNRRKRFAYNFILRRIFELPHVQRRLGEKRSLNLRDLVKPLSCQVRCAEYYKILNGILAKNIFD